MKKEKVKEKLFDIRAAIIDEIEDPSEEMSLFLLKHEEDSMDYGYKVGMSRAAMIMLEKIYEMFPEEKEED